ncbi:hypothetical protein SAMN05192574_105258 [Mucilaginibacter gossypiicola]|uniref:Uncharacterized protein n=1 Tax=Mucilaginibacter gossypiicola TaxID=551995 RepID=A0A1H8LVD8_9SPHI|nr:hypothetical protein [Mucilaginibacter gossypiicola]SEO08846.1 hypothetical protein SAMN05192574_105258 [Mucilaginibacter gossypiicola]
MESETPSFRFALEYAGESVNCEVVMKSACYDILFDDRWMASIEHTDDFTWIQASGVILPESIIDEIGLRVESEYK